MNEQVEATLRAIWERESGGVEETEFEVEVNKVEFENSKESQNTNKTTKI